MARGDGRFLAAMLGARAGEHADDLAEECSLDPEAAGLVQEVAHLCAHVAEARERTEDDGVVRREFVYATNGSGLVQLHAGFFGDFLRHQFRSTLDGDLSAWHRASAFGDRLGHLLDVTPRAVIEDENLRHRQPPASFSYRWRMTARRKASFSNRADLGQNRIRR